MEVLEQEPKRFEVVKAQAPGHLGEGGGLGPGEHGGHGRGQFHQLELSDGIPEGQKEGWFGQGDRVLRRCALDRMGIGHHLGGRSQGEPVGAP